MSKAIAAVGFDYGEIDKDSKGKLLYLAGQIRKHAKGHIEHALAMGEQIQEAHEVLAKAGCEGRFSAWIKAECGISRQTAYNYMNAFSRFGDQSSKLGQFTAEAVYLLSGEKVSDQAVKEALKLADKGQRINKETAKATLDKFREATTRAVKTKPADAAANPSGPTPPPPTEGTASQAERGSQGGESGENLGKCPNCAGTKWDDGDLGISCAKCGHPHGEPAGDVDADRIGDQRAKTVKTVEALMRAFDDLNHLCRHPKEHANAIAQCKFLLKEAREWK